MKTSLIHMVCGAVIWAVAIRPALGVLWLPDSFHAPANRMTPGECDADWTLEMLFAKADAVVIAAPTSSEPTKETMNLLQARGINVDLGGVNTTFTVRHSLKGSPGKEFVLFHYRVTKNREKVLEDPPELVEFRTKPITVDVDEERTVVPPPAYLLFLKKRSDGKYAPLAGDLDPVDSVFEVTPPWSDALSLKR